MANLFNCSWETGTNLINSSPIAPETSFNSALNETTGGWEKLSDSKGLQGQTSYAKLTATGINRVCILSFTSRNLSFARVALHVESHSLAVGNYKTILRAEDGSTVRNEVRVKNVAGQLTVIGSASTETNGTIQYGAVDIDIGKYYQIELMTQRNTFEGSQFKVWNEVGDTQIGTTQILSDTTRNQPHTGYRIGGVAINISFVSRFDAVIVDDADWAGPLISTPVATKLVYGTPPTTPVLKDSGWNAFTVEAHTAGDAVDTSYTGNVTISLATGTGSLGGTLTKACVAGVATFDDITYDTEEAIKIDVASGALTGIVGTDVTVTAPVVSGGSTKPKSSVTTGSMII